LPQLRVESFGYKLGFDSREWRSVQREFFDFALEASGIKEEILKSVRLSAPQQMLFSGLLIMSDWIASGEKDVPLTDGWGIGSEDNNWSELDIYEQRFDFNGKTANAVQRAVADAMLRTKQPGIVIIEAPMGSGKTESALSAAEILAEKTGRGGIYFALPTQATANGILSRVVGWVNRITPAYRKTLTLAHGKAAFDRDFQELERIQVIDEDSSGGAVVNEWFKKKTSLLADFGVGTIDQLLMCALRQRHVALRHLGIANKVVVIDEVHAYGAYMLSYLQRVLEWLGAYGVPVIVLSATLPPNTRQQLSESYLRKKFQKKISVGGKFKKNKETSLAPDWAVSAQYPLITYSDGEMICQISPDADLSRASEVVVERFTGDICDKLSELLTEGGCAGIFMNTVKGSQELAKMLTERFGSCVRLLHAGFISADRAKKERELLELIGPPEKSKRPEKLIVIGTQVMEQSLDLDYDLVFTQICPIDLLIQRTGRLHRHIRARPQRLECPRCYVLNSAEFDAGSLAVYGRYMLMTARTLLPNILRLPQDIPTLVHAAYGGAVRVQKDEAAEYTAAKAEYDTAIKNQKSKSVDFQLFSPPPP
jgi:CRISPR-associated endonuclease/helicase Cas3